ncbi:MAG: hypothetical protein PVG03_09070 [Desulfarculaceae bacterium]
MAHIACKESTTPVRQQKRAVTPLAKVVSSLQDLLGDDELVVTVLTSMLAQGIIKTRPRGHLQKCLEGNPL